MSTVSSPIAPAYADDADQVRMAKSRYCRYLDTRQWDAFSDLFVPTPDIRIFGESDELLVSFSTREAFVEAARGYLQGARSIHQVHNEELTRASQGEIGAIWSMEDLILFPDDASGRPARHHGFGHYHETWVRDAAGWRISQMALRRTILQITPQAAA